MPTLTCNECGDEITFEDEEYDDLFEWAGWENIDGEYYCPKCWDYDDFGNPITKGN